MIRYYRSGGWRPPQDREILGISNDGTFTMWRSVGMASYPPSPIGRFAGQLEPQFNKQLQRIAAVAAASGDLSIPPLPDSAIETVEVDDARAAVGSRSQPGGPWGELLDHLRPLLGALTKFPRAAVGVEFSSDGKTARLVQRGPETLRLDLSSLSISVVLWQRSEAAGEWTGPQGYFGDLTDVTATPGWSLDLPFEHGFAADEYSKVVAYVTFVAFDGESAIRVAVETY